jgi:hypothetical protein
MTNAIYEVVTSESGYTSIKRTDSDGTIWWIPSDPANADYQAYLNKNTLPSNSADTVEKPKK